MADVLLIDSVFLVWQLYPFNIMCPFLLWPSTYYWFVTIKIILYVPFLWSVESFTSQKSTMNLQSIGSFLKCWFIYFSQVNYQSQVYRLFLECWFIYFSQVDNQSVVSLGGIYYTRNPGPLCIFVSDHVFG